MDTPKKVTRSIVIEINEGSNDYTVREGERSCPDLCWDEMLGTIAELTHPLLGSARYRMHTPAGMNVSEYLDADIIKLIETKAAASLEE